MISITPFASGSDGNLYLLKQNNDYYLIECGLKKKEIINKLWSKGVMMSQLKGCFITHIHGDHCLSCNFVNEYTKIYACDDVIKQKKLNGVILESCKKIKVNDMVVLPFEVEHGNTKNLGFIFKDEDSTIMFATDFMKIITNISKIKFTEIFIECNYDEEIVDKAISDIANNESEDSQMYSKYIRQINTHLSFNNLKYHLSLLDLSCCQRIVLLHPSKFLIDKKKVECELKNDYCSQRVEYAT